MFELTSSYSPTGDQPLAIEKLTEGLKAGVKHQVLLGTTGSGKTFTVANAIRNISKPTLVIAHNKTLAAQLYQEFRDFFPNNSVEYFVSYYDYYQPESYVPQTDTYIEKDADINEEIDKLRLSATNSLITRKDVIIVSSVSCIYNIGSPAEYEKAALELREGMKVRLVDIQKRLSQLYYERSDFEFKRGTYRIRGGSLDIYLAYQDEAVRIEILDDKVVNITNFDPLTGNTVHNSSQPKVRSGSFYKEQGKGVYWDGKGGFCVVFPAKHYVSPEDRREEALLQIEHDLELRLKGFRDAGKVVEAYRLEQRTKFDLEMIREIGYCKGIENYSVYFDGRKPGSSPYTLIDFFPKDFLTVIDESHITVPQIRGMYNGDRSRKETLVEHGFRLPSAMENRPLKFDEFMRKVNQVIYTSATPDEWEKSISEGHIVEQLVRPTGIVDPRVVVLPTRGQIDDLLTRITERAGRKERVLVTTLTKRMAEELSSYLVESGVKVTYLHSDIDTLERTDVLDSLRKGDYDVLVGINLLREGIDLPEVSLVVVMDADKEGFLRSETSLIQTMGRAARHINGDVVMYADNVTGSMKNAIREVERRRGIQERYNALHGISPQSISKPIRGKLVEVVVSEDSDLLREKRNSIEDSEVDYTFMSPSQIKKEIKRMELEMKYQAEILNFEKAAKIRDTIRKIKREVDY